MKVSVILIDWSERESFHSIHYLNRQSIDRSSYELIWAEYFDRKIPLLEEHLRNGRLDKYIILGHKQGCYHKHKAWNAGVFNASGDIVVLCDSDAIFKNSFIQSIIDFFESTENSFLYIDQIRNENKDFWPFNYPAWEDVMSSAGLINWDVKRKTTIGMAPIYNDQPFTKRMLVRNYGACLCVKRSDYILFGGLDEHPSYSGYICGPYDLAVRMINGGMKEYWHGEEFIMHTYHPREKPGKDRMGPHYRNNSTTSLKHLFDGDVLPYDENEDICRLRMKIFPEPIREGTPKFSIIVPDAAPLLCRRLIQSIQNSTKHPFEVINCAPGKQLIKRPFLPELIAEGCKKASGDIIILIPAQAVFRRNSLDLLLDNIHKSDSGVKYLSAMETYTEGFTWQYANTFKFGGKMWRMAAFGRSMLSGNIKKGRLKEHLKEHLKKLLYADRNHQISIEKPVYLELWHDGSNPMEDRIGINEGLISNGKLKIMLDKMLELNYLLSNNKADWGTVAEARSLLEEILAADKDFPGSFLKYCFLKRYGIKDYWDFIGFFNRLDWSRLAAKGYKMLADGGPVLLTGINEEVEEAAWLYELLYAELKGFLDEAELLLNQIEQGAG